MLRDEAVHQRLAFSSVEINELHTSAHEEVLSASKVGVLADDHDGDFEKERGPSAHHARTERAYKYQPIPIPAPPSIADANNLGVSRRVAVLDPQVVSTRNDVAIAVSEYRPDRQAAFIPAFAGLCDCCLKKLVLVHVDLRLTRKSNAAQILALVWL